MIARELTEKIDRLKREMVVHLYNNSRTKPTSKRQKDKRIIGLFGTVESYVSDEYYKLSPAKYKIKYGDEGPSIAWYDACVVTHKKMIQEA